MNLKAQEKLFDIEWFEGPMMSLFTNNKGDLFIYKWVDANPNSHTWMVFRTTHSHIALYTQQVISEQALILLAPDESWHLVDINPKLEFSNKKQITAQTLNQTFLPKSHTFFRIGNCLEPEKLLAFTSKELVTT